MANLDGATTESPFHRGEQAIHARLGILERMDKQGRRFIRDYMLDQHRQFFAQLPYVIAGTVDAAGAPWASILVGNPGFLSSSDDRALRVTAKPLFGDPLGHTLAKGADIGLLGIELHTRRRNRLNGTVVAIDAEGFDVKVKQSFGNCPQYIQARMFELREDMLSASRVVWEVTTLEAQERKIISTSDTFFIATAHLDASAGTASGVDVSHRGGKPGFVRIDGDRSLTIPDFSGNLHFNTFGNLELNPRAGLLFIDFERGDLLYLTGTAVVIWDGDEINTYAGAERLLRFHLEKGYLLEGGLPLRWTEPEFSPFLDRMGAWQS
ncbi:pyridoxamine 5'-phosphate oxidase family protein [Pseudanabaena sp. PCC 6802]|uniref:pyridoxamine 5'-phosphate oxidase family protein n=1 Tax=Pseudanabaena sp. PCC 6802 TaxID=118173 RepID=UPI000344FEB9|nr:pyridoxamine 5'-phosphate oxidase family protein [Pseudanabaena sp. PCC 6802]